MATHVRTRLKKDPGSLLYYVVVSQAWSGACTCWSNPQGLAGPHLQPLRARALAAAAALAGRRGVCSATSRAVQRRQQRVCTALAALNESSHHL